MVNIDRRINPIQLILLFIFLIFCNGICFGQSIKYEFPNKQVRLIVPYAPGGPTDIIARLISQKLAEVWQQPVIVENRPGANGNLGTSYVAKSVGDGYTILLNTTSITVNASLFNNPGYSLEKDFIGVANVASSPNMIVAGKSLVAKNLKDALDEAKTGKLNYASPGEGTTPHLTAEYLFKVLAKVPVEPIHYKGAGPAVNAALTGEVQFSSVAVPAASQFIKTGKLIGLAVTSAKRLNNLPEVPTVAESGFADFEDYTWVGVFVPTSTPTAIVEKINVDIQKILDEPSFKDRLATVGFDAVGGNVSQFNQYLKKESLKWSKVVNEIGIAKQ
jgi:tripartite-type tricarboxylate transporter receptor subunit TctC